jgi:hypothetical protein
MVFIPKWEKYRDKKPDDTVSLNFAHELANGLLHYSHIPSSDDVVDYVTNARPELLFNQYFTRNKDGLVQTSTSSSSKGIMLPNYLVRNEGSIYLEYIPKAIYNYNSIFDLRDGDANDFEMWFYSDGRLGFRYQNGTTYRVIVNNVGVAGQPLRLVYYWKNGVKQGALIDGFGRYETTQPTYDGPIGKKFGVFGSNVFNSAGQGTLVSYGIWDHILPESAQQELLENPYQILKPRRKWFVFGAKSNSFNVSTELSHSYSVINSSSAQFDTQIDLNIVNDILSQLGSILDSNISLNSTLDSSTSPQTSSNLNIELINISNFNDSVLLDSVGNIELVSDISLVTNSLGNYNTNVELNLRNSVISSLGSILNGSVSLQINNSLNNSLQSILNTNIDLNIDNNYLTSLSSIIDSEVVLNHSSVISNNAQSVFNTSCSLASQLGLSSVVSKILNSSIQFNTGYGQTYTSLIETGVINAAIQLSNSLGYNELTNIDYNSSIQLDIHQQDVLGTQLDYNTSLALAVNNTLNSNAGKELLEAIQLQLQSNVDCSTFVSIEGSILLNHKESIDSSTVNNYDANVDFSIKLIDQLVSQAVLNLGLDLSYKIVDIIQGVNPAVIIKTNEGREILITIDNKELLISSNNRTIIYN